MTHHAKQFKWYIHCFNFSSQTCLPPSLGILKKIKLSAAIGYKIMFHSGNKHSKAHKLWHVLYIALASSILPAYAEGQLEEIIVTAQKREQTLQDVPSAVSAIDSEYVKDLTGAGENIRALAGRVPSLQIESSNGRQSPRFYIRGLGNYDFDVNATQPVSMIYDDVALENSVLKSIPLFDIQRIEVLKGPQGTLFGRSTTAGVIKIDSVDPTFEKEGYISGGYGSRGTFSSEGAVNSDLSDTWAARAAYKYLSRDAWIDNTVTGDEFGQFDEFSYRVKLLYQPNSDFRTLIKLHGFSQDGDMPQVFYANAFTPGVVGLRDEFDVETVSHDAPAGFELDHYGASVKVVYNFNDWEFNSVTAYDSLENFSQADIDGGLQGDDPAVIGVLGRQAFFSVSSGDGLSEHSQLTQEFRLSREAGKWFMQSGLYYLSEDITVDSVNFDNTGALLDLTQAAQETTSGAIFGQVEYAATDTLALTAGLRFIHDDKNLEVIPGEGSTAPADAVAASDSYWSWELAANYDLNADWVLYTRLATASRGPVTLGRFGFVSQADTENITSFETGFKSELWDNRARWNATAYVYQLDDQQLTATGGTGNTNELLNADKTNGSGLETELEILISSNVTLKANASYNKTEIDDPNLYAEKCSSTPSCTELDPIVDTFDGPFGEVNLVAIDGNPLPRAPEWLYNLILDFKFPLSSGSLYGSSDWNYRSESNIFLYESVEFVAEERWIGGLRLGYKTTDEVWDFALVGRNITDEIVADGALDFLNMTAFVNEPQYWGLELTVNW